MQRNSAPPADQHGTGCCAPGRTGSAERAPDAHPKPGGRAHGLVALPGGSFLMGTADDIGLPAEGEGPVREVLVEDFRIGRYAVSNREFAEFVDATGHRTDAEQYGWSFVFHLFLPDDFPPTRAVAAAPWWRQVYGADWCHPAGPETVLDDLMEHPVTHVSWNDAMAYCHWVGCRLPTEAEWEYAARGGLVQKRYVWGDEFSPGGETMCNIFEGTFPTNNTAEDGYVGTAPVDAFPANGYGLHNMAGNVWEWCGDWFSPTLHHTGPRENPSGPPNGTARVIRGGSYLCHDSYCNRYRVAGRSSDTHDSSTGNLGFRVAAEPARTDAS